MRNLLFLLLLVLSIITTVFSQVPPGAGTGAGKNVPKNGEIKGKIIDADSKAPMEYANVAIYSNQDSSLVTGRIADAQGAFQMTRLPYGTYYVVANFIGFEKTTVHNINITPNAHSIDLGIIELAPDSKTLGTVEVVGERSRVEYKIDKKVINVNQDINAAGGTAVTVLENTPSVEVDIDGNVQLRGSSSFTVLIDGRPSVLSGSDALKQIPSSAIENIEIITNPSVKYDPDGMAGIINVVMKKNILSGLNGIINVNAGTGDKYGTDVTMNYKTKKINLLFGANWNDNTDKGTMYSTRETNSNDSTSFLQTNGKNERTRNNKQVRAGFDYFLSDKTSLTVLGEVGTYSFENSSNSNIFKDVQTLNSRTLTYSAQPAKGSREGNSVSANASFLTKFDDNGLHKLEGSFEYRNRDGENVDNSMEVQTNELFIPTGNIIEHVRTSESEVSDDYRFKLDYTLPFKNGAKLEAGIQSNLENEKEGYKFENRDLLTGEFSENQYFSGNKKFYEGIHSVYSTYSGKIGKLEYMAGLRGEYTNRSLKVINRNENFKLDSINLFPSVHLSYQMGEKNQVMASYSKRINRPDGRDLDPSPNYMNQYSIRRGNPELRPEYTDSYELSYLLRLAGASYISVESFYRTTTNLMGRFQELKGDTLYMTTRNVNKDYSTGGEIMANINLTKWLLVNTSFTLYNYRVKGNLPGQEVDRKSTNYSGRVNTTVKFSADSRFQFTGFYRGPSANAQGSQKGMIFTNLSYRHEFMKKKLTATISLRDALGTGKYEGTNVGTNFRSVMRQQREPRVWMLTLSYKINNYKMERESSQEQPSQGDDSDDMF